MKSDVRLLPSHRGPLGLCDCETPNSNVLTLAADLGFQMFDISRNFQHNPRHLYILCNDEIKVGDWIFCDWSIRQVYKLKEIRDKYYVDDNGYYHPKKRKDGFDVKKIKFTTDETLGLSEVPKDFIRTFIEEYNKGSIIREANVETFNVMPKSFHSPVGHEIALDSSLNTVEVVNITPVKKLWSSEERQIIETIVRQYAFERHNMVHINDPWLNEWFKENI